MVGFAAPFAFDEGEGRWQIEICFWAYALQHDCSTMKVQAYIHGYRIPENEQVGEGVTGLSEFFTIIEFPVLQLEAQ
jgi:hypothetical protein